MRLREFWNRLTGGDRLERIAEKIEQDRAEQPEPVDDYEAIKDDVKVEERFPGGERIDFDADEPPESEKW